MRRIDSHASLFQHTGSLLLCQQLKLEIDHKLQVLINEPHKFSPDAAVQVNLIFRVIIGKSNYFHLKKEKEKKHKQKESI